MVVVLLLCTVAIGSGEDKLKKKLCKEHPMLSGPCFTVRGRMSIYVGNPGIRIWPVGTKRLLGISEYKYYLEDYDNIPDDLVKQLNVKNAMYADFTVCPFTKDKPGVMRLVCVESARNITMRENK